MLTPNLRHSSELIMENGASPEREMMINEIFEITEQEVVENEE
jgi:hypothetical protein